MSRFRVDTVHGESATLFHVIDTNAPEAEQPAIRRTFTDRECADIYTTEANRLDTEQARGFMLAADVREAERIEAHVREEVARIMVDEMMGEAVENYIADAAAEAARRAFVDQYSTPTRPDAAGLYLPVDASGRVIGPDPGDAGMRPALGASSLLDDVRENAS